PVSARIQARRQDHRLADATFGSFGGVATSGGFGGVATSGGFGGVATSGGFGGIATSGGGEEKLVEELGPHRHVVGHPLHADRLTVAVEVLWSQLAGDQAGEEIH